MKIIRRILAAALSLTLLAPIGARAADPEPQEMRGVWVSSVYNLDYPTKGRDIGRRPSKRGRPHSG